MKLSKIGALLACLALVGAMMFGCSDGAKEEVKQAEVKKVEKVVVKIGLDSDPVSLDPHVQLSGGMLQYSHMVFDPLIRWTQDMKFEGRLAEKWEQVNDTTMRFHLRKGVKFHSGNEMTSADVVFTLERLKKSVDFKGLFEPFEKAVAVDQYTVDLITKKPYGLVLNMATYLFPLDKAFYTGKDEKGLEKDAILKTDYSFANFNESGTGPYKVIAREQGIRMSMERFADYWDTKSLSNVDELILEPIPNGATRVAALLSGDVDFIMPVPPQDLDRVGSTDGITLITMSGSRIITLQLNGQRNPALANVKVRQAITYAINNAGIVEKIMKGFGTVAGQQGPKGFASYVKELTPRFDVEKAKQLMKEAGYENGFEATMITPNNRYVNDAKIAEAVVGMLSKIGVKIALKTMPKAQYWDEFDARAADIQMIGWHPDTEDAANYTEYLTMTGDGTYGTYNSGIYSNARVDELTIATQTETNIAKRSAMLQEIETILYNEAAFVPLHWQNMSWASKDNLNIADVVNTINYPYFGDLVVK